MFQQIERSDKVNSDSMQLFFKIFSGLLMVLLVVPLVDCAKGLVAKWQGDDTAEREGRITLNPLEHLDPLGAILIILIGFGWSKPMQINPSRFKNYKRGIVLVSLTGPITHFLAAIVCNMVVQFMLLKSVGFTNASGGLSLGYCIMLVLSMLSRINVCLGVISLLPLPPLDGFVILHQFAGPKFNSWYYSNYAAVNRGATLILFALFFAGRVTGGMFDPLGWLIDAVDMILSLATAWIPVLLGN